MVTFIRTRLAALLLGIVSTGVRAQDLTSVITAAASSVVQSATGTSTSSAAAATWTVNVGKLDHVFEPNIITANPGDTVLFNFYPKNHSVVRAEYECLHQAWTIASANMVVDMDILAYLMNFDILEKWEHGQDLSLSTLS